MALQKLGNNSGAAAFNYPHHEHTKMFDDVKMRRWRGEAGGQSR